MKKNNTKIIIIGILLLAVLAVSGFLVFGNESYSTKTDAKKVYSKYMISGNGLENFDLRFLQLESKEENLVYSPLSIKYALAMLSEGATGEAKTQIDDIIGKYKSNKYIDSPNMSFANAFFVNETGKDKIKQNYYDTLKNKFNAEIVYDKFENAKTINKWIKNKTLGLLDSAVKDEDVKSSDFYLVNALAIDMNWKNRIQAAYIYEDDFKYENEEYENKESGGHYSVTPIHEDFETTIFPIDGSYPTLKFNGVNNKVINAKSVKIDAVANKYDILKIVGEDNIRKTITEEYNKWKKENPDDVEEENTEKYVDQYIKDIGSNYNKVESSTDFRFYDDEDVKVFAKELKEYNGTTLEYIGIMPKKETLSEYIKDIDAKNINSLINNLKTIEKENFEEGVITHVFGQIPLFEYEYELNLKDDLKDLGIKDVFEKKGVLSNLTSDNEVLISKVGHKANIKFSNEGIKAVAATNESGSGDSYAGFKYDYPVKVKEINLNFDNPYLYIIRDKNSGEVWFMGTLYNPIENEN